MKILILVIFTIFGSFCSAQIQKITEIKRIPEISGMIKYNNQYWALNDGGNPAILYQFDTLNGAIVDSTTFANVSNNDWEELSTNGTEIFIGDFGNNDGVRKDLRIYRFAANKLGLKNVKVDTIDFYYPEQKSFQASIFSNFDCEAMLAFADSIYLFSKSKADSKCRVYSLPNKSGYFAAQKTDSIDLNAWTTGAALDKNSKLFLCGYAIGSDLIPWITTANFSHGKFAKSSVKQTKLNLTFSTQIESLVLLDSNTVIGAAEKWNGFEATLYKWNIKNQTGNTIQHSQKLKSCFLLSPNPSAKTLHIISEYPQIVQALVFETSGKIISQFDIPPGSYSLDTQPFAAGAYLIVFKDGNNKVGSAKFYVE